MIRVLFVCMGNICRSPTAEGVVRHLLAQTADELKAAVEVDSAGTHGYHTGAPPDARAQRAARRRGIEIADLRARLVLEEDFESFDYILAMDPDNLDYLLDMCPRPHRTKVRLLMDFAPEASLRAVPDPYYGGASGFERVLDLVEQAATGLLEELRDMQSRD